MTCVGADTIVVTTVVGWAAVLRKILVSRSSMPGGPHVTNSVSPSSLLAIVSLA
jgi:hypothetical protein